MTKEMLWEIEKLGKLDKLKNQFLISLEAAKKMKKVKMKIVQKVKIIKKSFTNKSGFD